MMALSGGPSGERSAAVTGKEVFGKGKNSLMRRYCGFRNGVRGLVAVSCRQFHAAGQEPL
jgi:hypothetical protein